MINYLWSKVLFGYQYALFRNTKKSDSDMEVKMRDFVSNKSLMIIRDERKKIIKDKMRKTGLMTWHIKYLWIEHFYVMLVLFDFQHIWHTCLEFDIDQFWYAAKCLILYFLRSCHNWSWKIILVHPVYQNFFPFY